MPVSPDEVPADREYPPTPRGVLDFIDDRLMAHRWKAGDAHAIVVPEGLASCADYPAWCEIVALYRGKGWIVRSSVAGLDARRLTTVTLYFVRNR